MNKNTWGYAKDLVHKYDFHDSMLVRLALNGEKVEGVFCGDPYVQEYVWTGNSYEHYDPRNHSSQHPFPWFMVNFYVPESNRMKIIEGGKNWMERVLDVKEKFPFNDWAFEVLYKYNERVGKPHYVVIPSKKLENETREKVHRAVPLNFDELRIFHNKGPAHQLRWYDENRTIGYELASKIYSRLKVFPKETVQNFLSRFEIKRVRDLKANDTCKALVYLDYIESGIDIDWTDAEHPFLTGDN